MKSLTDLVTGQDEDHDNGDNMDNNEGNDSAFAIVMAITRPLSGPTMKTEIAFVLTLSNKKDIVWTCPQDPGQPFPLQSQRQLQPSFGSGQRQCWKEFYLLKVESYLLSERHLSLNSNRLSDWSKDKWCSSSKCVEFLIDNLLLSITSEGHLEIIQLYSTWLWRKDCPRTVTSKNLIWRWHKFLKLIHWCLLYLKIWWIDRGGDGWRGLLHFDWENSLCQLFSCSRLRIINSSLLPVFL